jgi:hypothetical protein
VTFNLKPMPEKLFHFTCNERAAMILRDHNTLRPGALGLLWLTDLDVPYREPLGLTSHSLSCDRTQNRFEVTDLDDVVPWLNLRRELNRDWVAALESAPGVMPAHWYVSITPRIGTLAPLR